MDDTAADFLARKSEELAVRAQRSAALDDIPDEQSQVAASPEDNAFWKLSCSVVRLSRTDPAEQVFVKMLLRSDPELARSPDKPIAFPVFGRGRALCALVGGGINRETVEEVIVFLAGPCSCVAKELNPGVDLLISADWQGMIPQETDLREAPPTLTGIMPEGPLAEGDMHDGHDDSMTEGPLASSLLRNVLILLLAVIIAVGVGVAVLRRRPAGMRP